MNTLLNPRKLGPILFLGAAIVLVIIAPMMKINLMLSLQLALVYALFATAVNLLLGFTGILSFGHGLYLGLAAYVIAIGWKDTNLPFELLVPAAILIPTLLSLVLGAIALRTRKFYLGILTLAFTQLFFVLSRQFYELTGGDTGIFGPMVPEWLARPLPGFQLTVIIVLLSMGALWVLTISPFGSSLRSIRDNRQRAQALGIGVYKHELIAFTVSGFFTAVAGLLFAIGQQSAYPSLFEWHFSGIPLFMALIGGMYFFIGPMVGAFIYHYGREFLLSYLDNWQIFFGFAILAVVLFAPGGVVGLLVKLRDWVTTRFLTRTESETSNSDAHADEEVSR